MAVLALCRKDIFPRFPDSLSRRDCSFGAIIMAPLSNSRPTHINSVCHTRAVPPATLAQSGLKNRLTMTRPDEMGLETASHKNALKDVSIADSSFLFQW